ncbi:MAG: ribbon-helix-helix domain-containing protein [Candidatus Diapherotrites archaeon]|nr:ribbon-helix-helix domain-containing protein [Candidatus Diapherotrites archaeon]
MNKMINLRLEDKLLKELDKFVKETTFSNRSEAIKAAIRKYIQDHENKQLIKELRRGLGAGKRLGIKEPTEEEFEKIKENVGKEIQKEMGLI